MKRHIKNLTEDELYDYFESINEKKYRIKQLYNALYQNKFDSFSEILNFSPLLRTKLTSDFDIYSLSYLDKTIAVDGTQKILFLTNDKNIIETVFLPNAETDGTNT